MRILMLLILLPASAWAGIGAHGGNVVQCNGVPTVTLDYYNATLPTGNGNPDLVDISTLSFGETVALLEQRMNGLAIQYLYFETKAALGPVSSWLQTSLKDVDDSAEPYVLPSGCQRVTAAVRQGETVYLDPSVYQLLSPAQQGLLYVHEILYATSRLESSAAVRDFFRVFLQRTPQMNDKFRVVHKLGPVYMFEFLNYESETRSREFSYSVEFSDVNVTRMTFTMEQRPVTFHFSCNSTGAICKAAELDSNNTFHHYSLKFDGPDRVEMKNEETGEASRFYRKISPTFAPTFLR
jgi:hypothetical protein